MPYPNLPDRRIAYNEDGTDVKIITIAGGTIVTLSAANMDEINDIDYTIFSFTQQDVDTYLVFFLPMALEVSGFFGLMGKGSTINKGPATIEGSNDTSNGVDGSWSAGTAYTPNSADDNFDSWRDNIATAEFSGVDYLVYRIKFEAAPFTELNFVAIAHLYGQPTAAPTVEADLPILFMDPDDSDNEFALPVDFGSVPAGTSSQKTFKVRNNHATLTANNIVLDVTDSDDIVRIGVSSGGPWLLQQTIVSLAPVTNSATFYIKSEGPAPPTPLEPKSVPIVATVGSFT